MTDTVTVKAEPAEVVTAPSADAAVIDQVVQARVDGELAQEAATEAVEAVEIVEARQEGLEAWQLHLQERLSQLENREILISAEELQTMRDQIASLMTQLEATTQPQTLPEAMAEAVAENPEVSLAAMASSETLTELSDETPMDLQGESGADVQAGSPAAAMIVAVPNQPVRAKPRARLV